MTVITGMHRSRTSMAGNLLMSFGIPLGDSSTFYRKDEWNAKGYFEQNDVVDINSQLITGFIRSHGKLKALLSQKI